jgi:hypothetical protein
VRLAWGSESIARTRLPCWARSREVKKIVVVFPCPPEREMLEQVRMGKSEWNKLQHSEMISGILDMQVSGYVDTCT